MLRSGVRVPPLLLRNAVSCNKLGAFLFVASILIPPGGSMSGSTGPKFEVPLVPQTSRKRRQTVSAIVPALIVAASIIAYGFITRYEVACSSSACIRLDRMTGDVVLAPDALEY